MKTEFEILDKSKGLERTAEARYNAIVSCLDGKSEMYEIVNFDEADPNYSMKFYRDGKTTAAISIEVDLENDKSPLLTMVSGNEDEMGATFKRIKSVIPDVFSFRKIGKK